MSEFLKFARQVVLNPRQVQAIAPSSVVLCQAMAAACPDLSGPVIELGGGTGKVTRALLDAGCRQEDLHIIEINPDFARMLQERFPSAHVHQASAEDVDTLGIGPASVVVSGLPLLGFSTPMQERIIGSAFRALRPGGAYVQYTYGLHPPIREQIRHDLGLEHVVTAHVLWNLPPAHVYRFTKAAGPRPG